MLEPSEDFKLPNGLSSEAKLDDDTLGINLDLSDSLFVTGALFVLLFFDLFEPCVTHFVQELDELLTNLVVDE